MMGWSTLVYIGGDNPTSNQNNYLEWHLGMLEAGTVQTITFIAKASTQVNTGVSNTAYLLGPFTPLNPSQLMTYSTGNATTPFGPTAITLNAFTARSAVNGVEITWQTGTEINPLDLASTAAAPAFARMQC